MAFSKKCDDTASSTDSVSAEEFAFLDSGVALSDLLQPDSAKNTNNIAIKAGMINLLEDYFLMQRTENL